MVAQPIAARFPRASPRAASTPLTAGSLPQVVNLVLYEGDDFFLALTVTDVNNNPADFTGATAMAQIRTTTDAATDIAFDATISGNVINLHLTSANSSGLRNGVWDCQVTYSDTTVQTLAFGTVTVTPQVTR